VSALVHRVGLCVLVVLALFGVRFASELGKGAKIATAQSLACQPPPPSVAIGNSMQGGERLEVVSGGPYTGYAGTPVMFSGRVDSNTVQPAVFSYQWNFGDGTGGSDRITSHVYQQPGSYTATFVVSCGADTDNPSVQQVLYSDTTTVTIQPPYSPVQASAGGPYTGSVGTPVAFTAATGGSAPVSGSDCLWSFGDGTTGQGQVPFHTYTSPGTFEVTLTVEAGGESSAARTSVTVRPAASVSHTGSNTITATNTTAAAHPSGPAITYPAGWNLIAAPQGTPFPRTDGPLYTFQPGDTSYESLTPSSTFQAGVGYWAYFATPMTITLSGVSTTSAAVQIPAGDWVLVGNPSSTASVNIHDATSAFGWAPQTSSYEQVSSLAPGEAAWVSVGQTDVVALEP